MVGAALALTSRKKISWIKQVNANVYAVASASLSIQNGASTITPYLSGQTDQSKSCIVTRLKFSTTKLGQQKPTATANSRKPVSPTRVVIYTHSQA